MRRRIPQALPTSIGSIPETSSRYFEHHCPSPSANDCRRESCTHANRRMCLKNESNGSTTDSPHRHRRNRQRLAVAKIFSRHLCANCPKRRPNLPILSIYAFTDWTDVGWRSMINSRSLPTFDEFEPFSPAYFVDCHDGSERRARCGNFDPNC